MTLIDNIKDMKINIIGNNGVITIDNKIYYNKCLLIAIADGIAKISSNNKNSIIRVLIEMALNHNVQKNQMIDTIDHIILLRKIEEYFSIQLHIRSSYDGKFGYINYSNPTVDDTVINILCLANSSGDILKGHFVCVNANYCLG
jgi:hypothetical protein